MGRNRPPERRMKGHELLGAVERELISSTFLLEQEVGKRRQAAPYEPPPKRASRPSRYDPAKGRAYREARNAKWRALGLMK